MSEAKLKHLEFIQGVITRMNANSFLIKGWSVTLVAALFALAAKDSNIKFALVAYVPVIVFWVLDGYYLSQERRYRGLFRDVVQAGGPAIAEFDMDASARGGAKASWACSAFSTTIGVFHGALLLVTLVVMFVITRAC